MPPADDILPALSTQGLTLEKNVVLVTSTVIVPDDLNNATRVAATLQYAGHAVNKVSILDGGFEGWVGAGGDISNHPVVPKPASYTGHVNNHLIVERAHVHARLNKADEGIVLIDVRPVTEFAQGHIESALSVPQINIWNNNGTFKPAEELLALFENGIDDAPVGPSEGEIIVYCVTGRTATGWHYALTNVLGFRNVKLYDGSIQDWVKEYSLVTS